MIVISRPVSPAPMTRPLSRSSSSQPDQTAMITSANDVPARARPFGSQVRPKS